MDGDVKRERHEDAPLTYLPLSEVRFPEADSSSLMRDKAQPLVPE